MSLVVANGAIYNRIVIPGKTRLLTPRRGTGQGGGGSGSAPFAFPSWGRGKRCGAGGRQPARVLPSPLPRSVRSRVRPSPSCLLQGRSPCPCLTLLSPPGSLCWPRMPERLPAPKQDSGEAAGTGRDGRDGMALPVALPGEPRLVPSPCWLPGRDVQALQSPGTGFPQLPLSWSLRFFAKEVLALGRRAKPALSHPQGHP